MNQNNQTLRVLYYNWAPLNGGEGGGVGVYLKNLMDFITSASDSTIIPTFLSSGYFYDDKRCPYIVKDIDCKWVESYYICNSPIIAPLEDMVTDFRMLNNDNITVRLFQEFIEEHGPFDVIHFHSFEGLSPNVLRLKEKFPYVKIVHSIHDYGIICPNVRLWTSSEENCFLNKGAKHCLGCLCKHLQYSVKFHRDMRIAKSERQKQIYERYKRIQRWKQRFQKTLRLCGLTRVAYNSSDKIFDEYRHHCISLINRFSDIEICVSNRVADIAKEAGIEERKVMVDYIGTKVADEAIYSNRNNPYSATFTILYMGYMRIEKGGYMLLDLLEKIASEGKDVVLKFATKISDKKVRMRIEKLKSEYKHIVIYDGYTHNDFPVIMKDVNIAIVPPLWEDNLPQVAIELIANGIPVLTSSYGGAHELNSHSAFVFKDANDLQNKLLNIKEHRELLVEYWKNVKPLTTMSQHINNLIRVYRHD